MYVIVPFTCNALLNREFLRVLSGGIRMKQVFGRRFWQVVLLLSLNMSLASCTRTVQNDRNPQLPTEAAIAVVPLATSASDGVSPDATVAGNDTAVVPPPTDGTLQPGAETPVSDTPRIDVTETAVPLPPTAEAQNPTPVSGDGTVVNPPPVTTDPTQPTAVPPLTDPGVPPISGATTHTVVAGENLYRIGLQYGVSWVKLAEYNHLNNANQLVVGQVLQIPSATAPTQQPTPSPLTETTYIVKPGDNLFRIGLAYGIDWSQIAEANGIVNPNQVIAGQELKIPVNTPGPTPQFTHQVKPGETLFQIALQYGVSWTAVAEANKLTSPYIIYPGQSLIIPGG